MPTFEVIKVGKKSIAGDELWTVLRYDTAGTVRIGGFGFPVADCAGGDHHWVRKIFAERAMRLYEDRPELHGCSTETELADSYMQQYGERMFQLPNTEEK